MQFPQGFLWGAATAAYQIEGSPLADGAGASIWHRFSHTPGTILNGDTGDVACDHYRRWQEDIEWMKRLGLNAYRFSVAWGRVLPTGRGAVNHKGLDFYKRLVDGLLQAGITPMITLYHWDLPAELQDCGGWANRDCAKWFADYACFMFRELGDRVPLWATLNEPWVVMALGYLWGQHAPGMRDIGAAAKAGHHLLLGHGKAVQAFRAQGLPNARIGIVTNLGPQQPASDSPQDQMVAALWHNFINRYFLDPIFRGEYPDTVINFIGEFAPKAAPDDMRIIQSQIDFLGVNYYTRNVLAYDASDPIGSRTVFQEGKLHTEMGWEVYPEGLYEILKWVYEEYGEIPLYITENGAAFPDTPNPQGEVDDPLRVDYIRTHLEQAHRAIREGVPLKGYFYWSLMDNFEWAFGYSKRFGLLYVDFETQKRTMKSSGRWYAEFIAGQRR
ncbi:MAG: beta-glucosidase [Armatimonadetes bacterium JP3_11]|jgi:beta-glucosidase|nr:MAG: beta-glucosidase [Armatimonadetes bacterium CP1_7O]OYT74853.1 MAG: beta-glucosidase [Armatimonadetes bacterium JP3_11]RMH08531.1 MAG: beta-glucosidase [Armatimonadota bacterium]